MNNLPITTIKSWAEEDRPREKMMLKGRNALSDAELLAILIGSGTRDISAVELAREILANSHNSLAELSQRSISDFIKFKGIGEAKAITLYAALEIARRRASSGDKVRFKVCSSRDAFNYIKADLSDLNHEEFYVILLNRANEIIGKSQISKGGLSGTIADGKVIFSKALELKSSALILAHNHPSGQLKPSEEDKKLTKSYIAFGKYIDLHILDHLIIADDNYYSFADDGLM